jgi:hypothetical protein
VVSFPFHADTISADERGRETDRCPAYGSYGARWPRFSVRIGYESYAARPMSRCLWTLAMTQAQSRPERGAEDEALSYQVHRLFGYARSRPMTSLQSLVPFPRCTTYISTTSGYCGGLAPWMW